MPNILDIGLSTNNTHTKLNIFFGLFTSISWICLTLITRKLFRYLLNIWIHYNILLKTFKFIKYLTVLHLISWIRSGSHLHILGMSKIILGQAKNREDK